MSLAEAWLLPIDVTIGLLAARAAQIENASGSGESDSGASCIDGPNGTRRYKFGKGSAGLDGLRQALRTGKP